MQYNVITQEDFQSRILNGAVLSGFDVILTTPLLFASDVTITDCIFRYRSDATQQLFNIDDVSGMTVTNNTFICNQAGEGIHGIRVSGQVDDTVISGNTIIAPSGYGIGIQFLIKHTNLNINFNKIIHPACDGIDIKMDLQDEPLVLVGNEIFSWGLEKSGQAAIDCRGLVHVIGGTCWGTNRSQEKAAIRFRKEKDGQPSSSGAVLYSGLGSVQDTLFNNVPNKKKVVVIGKPKNRVEISIGD